MAEVVVILDNQKWMVEIDLDEGEVVGILEPKLTIPEEKALIEEKQRAKATEIAEADPRVQEILQKGRCGEGARRN